MTNAKLDYDRRFLSATEILKELSFLQKRYLKKKKKKKPWNNNRMSIELNVY